MSQRASYLIAFSLLVCGITVAAPTDDAMVTIAAGKFQMGGDAAESAHTVTITSFALAKNLVTRAEYEKFVNETEYDAGKGWRNGCRIVLLKTTKMRRKMAAP